MSEINGWSDKIHIYWKYIILIMLGIGACITNIIFVVQELR